MTRARSVILVCVCVRRTGERTLLRVFQSIVLRASANSADSNALRVLMTARGSVNASCDPSLVATEDCKTLSSSVGFTSVTSSEKYASPWMFEMRVWRSALALKSEDGRAAANVVSVS